MSSQKPIWTIVSMLEWATDYFTEKKVKSPRLSIEWLIAHVLQKKRLDLYIDFDRPFSEDELTELRALVKRRALHEPLQYIVGSTDFYNTTLEVNPSVLIPRQETEQLVEIILENHSKSTSLNVIDLGCGSGCIPISLAMERPEWSLNATDLSGEALELAKSNAKRNDVVVNFFQHDFFTPLPKDFSNSLDILISNPPYILKTEQNTLDKEVVDYEPTMALFCESTEMIFQALEKICALTLRENGKAYFEIHEEEGANSAKVFTDRGWQCTIAKDYSGKDRFLIISR